MEITVFGWLDKLRPPSSTPHSTRKKSSRKRPKHEGGPPITLRPRDCHSHVIPGVDDGSRNMNESLAMLRMLAELGVRHLVATPHIFPTRYPNEPEGLRPCFDALTEATKVAEIDIKLELGAEHYLDDSLLGRIRREAVLAFGEERYVLFETSTGNEMPADLFEVGKALLDRGYTPLLAHVERYGYLRGDEGRELLQDLRCAGVRFQVNRTVGAVNRPGVGPRGQTLAWLQKRGWIDEVGSDLHRPTQSGRPLAP